MDSCGKGNIDFWQMSPQWTDAWWTELLPALCPAGEWTHLRRSLDTVPLPLALLWKPLIGSSWARAITVARGVVLGWVALRELGCWKGRISLGWRSGARTLSLRKERCWTNRAIFLCSDFFSRLSFLHLTTEKGRFRELKGLRPSESGIAPG